MYLLERWLSHFSDHYTKKEIILSQATLCIHICTHTPIDTKIFLAIEIDHIRDYG